MIELVEAWMINNRVNLMLLDNLNDAALQATLSTRGGRTVGHQLAHLCSVRRGWVEVAEKKLLAGVPSIERDDGHDKRRLADAFQKSGDVLATVIRQAGENGGKVKGYKRGVTTLVTYMIAHEAHHRGSILLTLKQTGFKLNDQLKWGIWDWAKL